MRRTLKSYLARLEKQSVSPKFEVLWVDVDRGETHEGVIKARYGDQTPPWVEPLRCRGCLRVLPGLGAKRPS